jgi:phospholipase/carboxylesterase
MAQANHVLYFITGTDPAKSRLLLLHGSCGDECDLVPLADELAPGSPVIAVLGTVVIDGGFAFFHRLLDQLIDEAYISEREAVLANFIQNSMVSHGIAKASLAIGLTQPR